MKMRYRWAVMIVIVCLMATALTIGASAKTTCPGMPQGATNYFDPEKLTATEAADPFTVENGSLCLAPRNTGSKTYGNVIAYLDVPTALTGAKNGFVISFWTICSYGDTSGFYTVRFAEDEGSFYELKIGAQTASVINGDMWEYDKMTVPSTGFCLDNKEQDNYSGHWKKVEMWVRDGGNKLVVFINGEAMVDAEGKEGITLDGPIKGTTRLGFGDRSIGFIANGLRIYAVDPSAKAFEPDVDPDAAIRNAEAGTPGSEGGTGLPADARLKTTKDFSKNPENTEENPTDKTDKTEDENDDASLLWWCVGGGAALAIAIAVVVILLVRKNKKKAAPVVSDEPASSDESTSPDEPVSKEDAP